MKNIHKIAGWINVAALAAVIVALLFIIGMAPSFLLIIILVFSIIIFGIFFILNWRMEWSRSFKNVALLIANGLWILIMMTFVVTSFQVNTTLDKISSLGCVEDCAPEVELDAPMAIYISGEDSFGDVYAESRSDVNQIAVINPQTHRILLVNTPRDYYVKLHSYGLLPDKLTHAGNFGVGESMETLNDLYGIDMKHFVKINFSSLIKLVDILDNITVNSDVEFTDTSGNHYNVGPNELDSKQALAFSRERKAFDDGDRQRGKNQQKVIEAILNKMKIANILTNYQEILDALTGDLRTNIMGNDIKMIVQSIIKNQYQFESISVTGSGAMLPTYSYPYQDLYVMQPDEKSLNDAKTKINIFMN